MEKRTKEFIIIGALFLIIGGIAVYNRVSSMSKKDEITMIQVRHNDEVLQEIDITADGEYEIEVKLGHLHIEVKDEQYRVFDVDCPDKICEDVGWVKKGSDKLIVCLPNGINLVQVQEIIEHE